MNILASSIRLYQWSQLTKTTVRIVIGVHHLLTPTTARTSCTLTNCSGTGLAEATELGLKALPTILGRIGRCGGVAGDRRCPTGGNFSSSADNRCADRYFTSLPHPMEGGKC